MTKSRGLRVPKGTRPRWVAENQGKHLCGCGCGKAITLCPEHYPNAPRFIHGHNQLGVVRREKAPPKPCQCGCGQMATAEKRFRPGHNGLGQKRSEATRAKISEAHRGEKNWNYGKSPWNAGTGKPVPPPVPCQCGCGVLATAGRSFISGHNGRGQRLSNYVGRYVSAYHGYAYVHRPGHPFANKGWISEHRAVVEEHLREHDPHNKYLIVLGEDLYLPSEVIVHHINGVKDDNRLENLQPMTNFEHTRLHHDQGDIHHH